MTSPFEQTVLSIMRTTNVSRERAEAVARTNGYSPDAPAVTPKSVRVDDREAPIGGFVRDLKIDEDEEQAEVSKLFRAYGAIVRNTSQKRPSKVAPGIADLIVMFPNYYRGGFALWWEVKRQVGGEQRPDQIQFEKDCRASGWTYRLGDRYDAARYLLNLGLAEPGDGPLGIVRVHRPPETDPHILAGR